jgi:predicted nucleotidyltransferase
MTSFEIVEQGTILRATVGSTVHGLHHGGQDDRDEMAVFIEPPEYLLGLRLARKQGVRNPYRFEHWVERTQPEGARSGPGDLDLVAYSLRKYVRLALKGHPTVLLLLFVPDELTLIETELGRRLRQLRPAIVSKRAGRGYLGYLRGQKERLLGTRGHSELPARNALRRDPVEVIGAQE